MYVCKYKSAERSSAKCTPVVRMWGEQEGKNTHARLSVESGRDVDLSAIASAGLHGALKKYRSLCWKSKTQRLQTKTFI